MQGFKMQDIKKMEKLAKSCRIILGAKLSVVSAYFTIYTFNELPKELNKIEKISFILTVPNFIHIINTFISNW